jgi:hypothetical protein
MLAAQALISLIKYKHHSILERERERERERELSDLKVAFRVGTFLSKMIYICSLLS